jgi:hypothetical protein
LQQHPKDRHEACLFRTAPRFSQTIKNDLRMKKIKWSTVKKVLQLLVTIISTVIGTVAVQACGVLA